MDPGWGEVLAWEPPRRLAYLWHIYGDRADATEVENSFVEEGAGTTVRIVHRGWDRLGPRGPGLRARNQHGWTGLTGAYERWLLKTDGTPQGRPDG
ncbi:MAG: SRPBCC domain-containing protein [Actinomycetota bacterium]|nr:SRPBCC domain-containing protein [Actinomycetota bacterium]